MAIVDIDPNAHKREVPEVWARFRTVDVPDKAQTEAAGHVVYVTQDWVEWGKKGHTDSNDNTVRRVQKDSPKVWDVLKPHYEAWKQGQEPPLVGTPLRVWPAISSAQAATLGGVGIKTVEDLAAMTDGDCDRQTGWKNLRNRARAWKAASQDVGKIAEEVAALRSEVTALKERNTSLETANEELHTSLQATGKVEKPMMPLMPPKRASA